jgi:hypothetical protein
VSQLLEPPPDDLVMVGGVVRIYDVAPAVVDADMTCSGRLTLRCPFWPFDSSHLRLGDCSL